MRMTIRWAAKLLRVHPRTVVRALRADVTAHQDPEDYITSSDLALAFDSFPEVFEKDPKDEKHRLLKPKEAAAYIQVPDRTFRYWQMKNQITPVVRSGKTIRYTQAYLDTLELDD